MLKLCALVAAGLSLSFVMANSARADVTDDFTSGVNGWGHVGDSNTPPSLITSGGNPGNYIQITDLGEGISDFFTAPATYFGNDLGGTFSFDLLLQGNATADDDVRFSNGTETLVYFFPTQPTGTAWQHFAMTLSSADPNWHVGSFTGPTPTATDFQNVFSSVNSVEILADYITGPETVGLDNVDLHTVATPEPASLALATLGAALLLIRRRR